MVWGEALRWRRDARYRATALLTALLLVLSSLGIIAVPLGFRPVGLEHCWLLRSKYSLKADDEVIFRLSHADGASGRHSSVGPARGGCTPVWLKCRRGREWFVRSANRLRSLPCGWRNCGAACAGWRGGQS